MVYPRAREGTASIARPMACPMGLSPRTRGNHAPLPPPIKIGGSIPAHAGEPRKTTALKAAMKVYPRARGGTVPRPQLRNV